MNRSSTVLRRVFRSSSATRHQCQCQCRRRFATDAGTSSSLPSKRPKTALFFPGQGVQRVGMANQWLEAFPRTAKPIMDELDELMGFKLSTIIADGPSKLLTETENAQPAILGTSFLILHVLEKEFGFDIDNRIDVVLGHSLGEFAALVAGGYMKWQDAAVLVRKRALKVVECTKQAIEASGGGEYGMIALVCERDHMDEMTQAIRDFLGRSSINYSRHDSSEPMGPIDEVGIANINSREQIVISGNVARMQTLLTNLRQFGGHDPRAIRLHASAPFHSPLLDPARVSVLEWLSQPRELITFPGRMPCISNVAARPFKSKQDLKDLLARQCSETVHWVESIHYLDETVKVRRWIGVGPGKVGRNLVGKEVGMEGGGGGRGGGVWGITEVKEIEQILKELELSEQIYDQE